MCLIYRPKKRPAFTRLCHRYRDRRGDHVPGEWNCGEYPKPGRRNQPTGPSRPPPQCKCGAAALRGLDICEQCYIQEQIDRMGPEALEMLRKSRAGTGPERTSISLTGGQTQLWNDSTK